MINYLLYCNIFLACRFAFVKPKMSKLNFLLLLSGIVLMLKSPHEVKALNAANDYFNISNFFESFIDNTNNSDLGGVYANYFDYGSMFNINNTDYWPFGNWSTNDTDLGGGFGYYAPGGWFYFSVGHSNFKTKR